jgi:hypothetical protein
LYWLYSVRSGLSDRRIGDGTLGWLQGSTDCVFTPD